MGVDVNDEAAAEAMAATEQGGEGVGVTDEDVTVADEAHDTNVAEEVTVHAPTAGRRDVVLHDPGDDGA